MGLSPASRAARSFRFTTSSVSQKCCLRSECPRITYVQRSASIGADTSPVYAPRSSKCMFCAPTAVDEPSSASLTAIRDTSGGQTTFPTPSMASSGSLSAEARDTASAIVVFIFQFPATMGVGMSYLPRSVVSCRWDRSASPDVRC